jgi:dipeptidase D
VSFVSSFEPRPLWAHFDRILKIPRGSKEEDRIRRHVIEVAERQGVEHHTDAAGNVLVRKPGTAGREHAPVTILQGHLDMVNEKDSGVAHDFGSDPICPRQEGEWLYATGTTLGADNGIGVAAMLALLEASDVPHGPLELLFTIDEETGLTGASGLDASRLTGRRLINLDSEEEGDVTVGCAGGSGTVLRLPVESGAATGTALTLRLRGLRGGHSGMNIVLQRGNAVKLLARILTAASEATNFRLVRLEGGNMHNAIPREAEATVLVAGDAAAFRAAVEAELAAVKAEFQAADPEITLEIGDATSPGRAWTPEATAKVLRLLEALPHGVLAMSPDIPGLVETSTNLATVKVEGDTLEVGTSSRSSVGSALRATRRRITAIAELAGAAVEHGHGYPGWKPDLKSPLLATVKAVELEVYGHEPNIVAVHAGLECGIIGEKVPGMDMVSIGPQIEAPHSPNERVHVESVGRFWRLLAVVLDRLSA